MSKNLSQNSPITDNARTVREQISLLELICRCRVYWKQIAAMTLLAGLLTGLFVWLFVEPVYEAQATIYITSSQQTSMDYQDLQISSAMMQDCRKIFSLREVQEMVCRNLEYSCTPGQLQDMSSILHEEGTHMLDVLVRNGTPEAAAIIANEYAQAGCEWITTTLTGVTATVISSAVTAEEPASPGMPLLVVLGALAGGLLGLIWQTVKLAFEDNGKEEAAVGQIPLK